MHDRLLCYAHIRTHIHSYTITYVYICTLYLFSKTACTNWENYVYVGRSMFVCMCAHMQLLKFIWMRILCFDYRLIHSTLSNHKTAGGHIKHLEWMAAVVASWSGASHASHTPNAPVLCGAMLYYVGWGGGVVNVHAIQIN